MAEKKLKFRSISALGDYSDATKFVKPSKADPSQDEPIGTIVTRFIAGGGIMQRPSTAPNLKPGEVEAQFNTLPPQERDGFDIADAGPIIDAGTKAAETLAASTPAPAVQPAVPPVTPEQPK